MKFRNATYISVSILAMGLVLPTVAMSADLIITDPTATTTNDGTPVGDFANVNITGNVQVGTGDGPAIEVDDVNYDFFNSGSLSSVDSQAVIVNDVISGNFTNSGNISGNDDAVRIYGASGVGVFKNVINSGYINSLNDEGFQVGSWNESADIGGNFFNNGTISGADSGVKVWGEVVGSFTNAGTITGRGDRGVYIDEGLGGNFTNSGNISGVDDAVRINGNIFGDVTNSGYINSLSDDGFQVGSWDDGDEEGNIGGSFYNNGTISGADSGVKVWGSVDGSFTNAGTIIGRGNDGVYIEDELGMGFLNSGNISGDDTGVYIEDEISTGGFTNSGNIVGFNDRGVFIDDDVNGGFSNSGNISGADDGVRINGNIVGNVFNSGYINSIGDDGFQVGSWNESASIDGNFLNNGTISGQDSGVKVWGSVSGSFTNYGSINGDDNDGVYIDEAVGKGFFNYGNISGDDTGVYIGEKISQGGFFNSGNIVGTDEDGVYIGDDVNGGFTNSGKIEGLTDDGVYIYGDVSGGFVNNAGASIYGDETGVYLDASLTGGFVNSGKIEGMDGYGVYIDGKVSGGFTNYGNITGEDTAVYLNDDVSGGFVNTGNITSLDGSYAVYISGDLGDGFNNTGDIIGNTGVYISGAVSSGGFFNSGDITGRTSYGVYISEEVAGGFTNTGNITGSTGVEISGNVTGQFFNSGNIVGETYAVYISEGFKSGFVNTGRIEASSEYGVYVNDYSSGGFFNSGSISAIYSAVYINGDLTGGFENTGDIESTEDYAVYIEGDLADGFLNTGNISSTDTAVYIDGNLTGGFKNDGTIESAETGVFIYANVTGGFENTGSITGDTGVYIEYGNVRGGFTNSGDITGTAYTGVYIGYDLDGFNNSGNISANVAGDYYALEIAGNLTGDFINTGEMSIHDADKVHDWPYAAHVDGEFNGNFTSTWGQGLAADGEINIKGKTVTAYINKYVEDGDTWAALQSNSSIAFDGDDYYLGQRIADTSALVDVSVDQDLSDDNNLVLSASRNRITSLVGGGYGLAGALDGVIDGLEAGGGTNATNWQLIDLLYAQGSAGSVEDVISEFSPDQRGGATTAALNQQVLINAVNMRLMGGLNSAQQVASLETNDQGIMPTADAPAPEGGLHMWFQALVGSASISDNDGVEGGDVGTGGVAVGVDGSDGEITAGAAFAYLHSTSSDSDDDFTVNSYMPAIYGKWQPHEWYISGIVSGGYHSVDQDRYNSYIDEDYDASYNVGQGSVRGEIGWDFGMSSYATLTPFVAASFNYLWTDGYDEGSADFALDVDGANDTYGIFEAGGKASMSVAGLNLNAMAGYRWGGLDYTVDAALASGLGFGTDVTSELGGVFVDADVMYAVSESVSVGVGYDGVFGEDVSANYGSVKVDWKF